MVFEKKQLSKVLAIALMVACAVAFMPLLNGQVFAAKKPGKAKITSLEQADTANDDGTYAVTVAYKAKKAKKYQVSYTDGTEAKTMKTKKKSVSFNGTVDSTYTVKVRGIKGKKKGKWSAAQEIKVEAKTPTPVPGSLTATQKGESIIEAVSGDALAAADKITLKKGSTEQTITTALSADMKTITITTANKLTDGDYVVTVTPADTAKQALEATVKCEAGKLTTLTFGKELVLKDAKTFDEAYVSLTGQNQFGEDVDISKVSVYASTATDGNPAYDAASKTVTVKKKGLPFTVGEEITFTAIYQDGTTVVQQTGVATVSNAAYVASMEFGQLDTTNVKLKDKKVVLKNFVKGSYYIPVTAKDQYGKDLTAEELTKKIADNALFVNPDSTAGVYGGFAGFKKLDDGTVAMMVTALPAKAMPGTATITVAALGGLSTSTQFTVEDNPYIDKLDVTFPSSLYTATEETFTVSAVDQYGEAVDLYELGATAAGDTITFKDLNGLTKGQSTIKATSGTFRIAKSETKKTLTFYYTPGSEAYATITISPANPKNISSQTLKIGEKGTIKSFSKSLKTTETTVEEGANFNFEENLIVVDSNGTQIDTADKVSALAYTTIADPLTLTSDGYYYQIKDEDGNIEAYPDYVAINKTQTYTVSLYQVKDSKAEKLDSKEFKISAAVPDPTTGFESYTAAVKEGDELLANWNGSGDKAEIIVKGEDAQGNVAKLSPADYQLTVNKGLDVFYNEIIPDSSIPGPAAAKDATEGKATVSVWVNGEVKTTVEVNYSNAEPVAQAGSFYNVTKDKVMDDESVDVDASATYDITGGVLTIHDVSTDYTVSIKDQYGLDIAGTSFVMNGATMPTSGSFPKDKNTILADNGNIDFTIYVGK